MVRHRSPIHEFASSVRRVGVVNSAALIISRLQDYFYDVRNRIDTSSRHELEDLDVDSELARHGQMYQPTGVMAFRRLMNRVELPKDPVFVDYGCGKGRLLLLAASEYPMARAVGIEFSETLCETARQNVEAFGVERLQCPIDIHCIDAQKYEYRGDENIFYFFYPFDAPLMENVLRSIEESLESSPRQALLVYFYAIHANVVLGSTVFNLTDDTNILGYRCLILTYDP